MSIDDLTDDQVRILSNLGASGWGSSFLPIENRSDAFQKALDDFILEGIIEGKQPSEWISDGDNPRYYLTKAALDKYSPISWQIDERAFQLAPRSNNVRSAPYFKEDL